MTNTHITLHGVSYVLPDGRTLFTDLNEQFDSRPTGLVGRNGVGKTLLAQMLAGLLAPTTGHCQRPARVHYLAQQVSAPSAKATVAELAGVHETLDALARIEAGSAALEDFEVVGEQWDMPQRLHLELERSGLGYLEAQTPADTLSGGEAMRVALVGAMLSEANFLILDEPSNHLDRPNRQTLIEQLKRWPGGLVVVSHDRQLLDTMERIVELSPLGLHSYGGNYTFYSTAKAHEQQAAQARLRQRKLARQREERDMHKQRERQEKRQARDNRKAKGANQAKILLDGQKARSEHSMGALRQQHTATQQALNQRVREAAQQVEKAAPIAVHQPALPRGANRRVAELERVALPFVAEATRHISLTLQGPQRVGITGPNGGGKSTLLRVLAGKLAPLSGSVSVTRENAYLDQRLDRLDPTQTVFDQLRAANRRARDGELRMLLAQLGLDAAKITTASGVLSGGERLKAALACLLYADAPPRLLMLDEPNNHLDLPSTQALETMLRGYPGTLLVVSHDDAFLGNLALTDYLQATEKGWQLVPV